MTSLKRAELVLKDNPYFNLLRKDTFMRTQVLVPLKELLMELDNTELSAEAFTELKEQSLDFINKLDQDLAGVGFEANVITEQSAVELHNLLTSALDELDEDEDDDEDIEDPDGVLVIDDEKEED